MNKQIWKYSCKAIGHLFSFDMPKGAEILTFQLQDGDMPVFWAAVVPSFPLEERTFILLGTGITYNFDGRETYIGTIQNGLFVWHLFEVKNG